MVYASVGTRQNRRCIRAEFEIKYVFIGTIRAQTHAMDDTNNTEDKIIIETRYGRLWIPGRDDIISRFLWNCGEWAWDETGFVASLLPEGARVADLAPISGPLALDFRSASVSVSFLCLVEANQKVLPLLEGNLRANATCPYAVVSAMVNGADPGYNVASWNLSQRPISIGEDGEIRAAGQLLRLFHFTKVNWVGEQMLERYSGSRIEVYQLMSWYRRQLAAYALAGLPERWWYYCAYVDGTPIPREHRRLYRDRADLRERSPIRFARGPRPLSVRSS